MTPALVIVAVAAFALVTAAGLFLAYRRLLRRLRDVAAQLDRAHAEFDRVIGEEIAARTDELERTLARARADSVSVLAEEERRIADLRRRALAEREQAVQNQLGDMLAEAQRRVEERLTRWTGDLGRAQEGLTEELKRLDQRQRQLLAEMGSRIGADSETLQSASDEQHTLIARLREDLERAAGEVVAQAQGELEQHAAERRRALHEVGERLRRREKDLSEQIERGQGEAVARIQATFADVERRQVEQLERVVGRAAVRLSEAANEQFGTAVKTAREEAARRLGRELDLAVERFAREAEGVLAEQMAQVGDSGAQRVDRRVTQMRAGLERQRDEFVADLERRSAEAEASMRERLSAFAADTEAERGVLEARLNELARRVDDALTRAQERLDSLGSIR